MRWMVTWFSLTCLRFLRRPAFSLMLLLLPASAFFLARAEHDDSEAVRIALYAEDGADSLAGRTAEDLVNRQDGSAFSFYLAGDEQSLQDDVSARRAECGYVFTADLEGKLDRGENRRSILVYAAPSTVTDSLASETVFAALARRCDRKLLADYVSQDEVFGTRTVKHADGEESAAEAAERLYDRWLAGGKTFHFLFLTVSSEGAAAPAGTQDMSLFPVRGLIAVWLFLAALAGTVSLGMDEERGLFLPVPAVFRLPCCLACLAAPVGLCAVSGFAALFSGGCLSGGFPGALRELAALLIYVILLLLYGCALKQLIRSWRVLVCLLPFFLAGSLIFCPVFADIRQYVPRLGQLSLLFPPFYYLRLL